MKQTDLPIGRLGPIAQEYLLKAIDAAKLELGILAEDLRAGLRNGSSSPDLELAMATTDNLLGFKPKKRRRMTEEGERNRRKGYRKWLKRLRAEKLATQTLNDEPENKKWTLAQRRKMSKIQKIAWKKRRLNQQGKAA